jgi:hypothetical protein
MKDRYDPVAVEAGQFGHDHDGYRRYRLGWKVEMASGFWALRPAFRNSSIVLNRALFLTIYGLH